MVYKENKARRSNKTEFLSISIMFNSLHTILIYRETHVLFERVPKEQWLFNHIAEYVEELWFLNHVTNHVEELWILDMWCLFSIISCQFRSCRFHSCRFRIEIYIFQDFGFKGGLLGPRWRNSSNLSISLLTRVLILYFIFVFIIFLALMHLKQTFTYKN